MNKILCLFAALVLASSGMSQSLKSEYKWEEDIDWFARINPQLEEDAQILYRDRASEFIFENDNLFEYYYFRTVIYLKTQSAVDDNNKIYVNISSALELVDYNARVFIPGKEPRLLGDDALKEGTSEEGNKYNFFAVEGAEAGCIVDYYYLVKRYPSYRGVYAAVQAEVPVLDYRSRIISPMFLVFDMSTVNDTMHIYTDTTYTEQRVLVATAKNLKAVPDEMFSNGARHELMAFYKLKENLASGARNLYTYGDASQSIIERMSAGNAKKIDKAIEKFFKTSDLKFARDERDKIRRIEDHLKSRIVVMDYYSDDAEDVEAILKNRVANERGMTNLFYQVYRHYDIPFEVVMTCSRYDAPFDPSVENYALLSEYLMYFPTVDDYTMPTARFYRLGIIPYGYIHTNGLFIRTISAGDLVTGAGKVKFIKAPDSKHTRHDMYVEASLEEDLSQTRVKLKEEMTGYDAANYQPFFEYIDTEKQQELIEAPAKQVCEEAEIISAQATNKGMGHFMLDDYIVESEFLHPSLIESAGNKLLFKIGELIGPQAEMYQEQKRKTNVENTYAHQYYREIRFIIPEGYSCTNLDDLKMSIDPFEEHHSYFTSEYSVEGNVVTVKVTEVYNQMEIELEGYESFRKVINAAADFNKITLVLEAI